MKFSIGNKVKSMIQNWLEIIPAVNQTVVLQEKFPRETEVLRAQLWYRGDASELRQFFTQLGIGSGSFWSSVPGTDKVRKIHSGLPAIIADTLAYIVYSDMDDIEVEGEKGAAAFRAVSENTDFTSLVGGAIVDTLVTGDGAFKISVDDSLSPTPVVEFWGADKVDYRYKRGIELRLIASLKRNLSRHRQWEQDEGFQWTAWQAEKLRNVSSFRRECSAIMGEYIDVIDSETRQLMEEQFAEGEKLGEKSVSESIGDIAQLDRQPTFFGVDRTKLDNLIQEVTVLEKHVETAALRMTDDVYRQTLNRVQLAMASGSMTLNQAIDLAVKDFLDKGINCIVYRDGRRINIADYVRMALRTTSTRAALQGMSAKIQDMGYDTVRVSQYSMCSDTCLQWQGRVYINDVFTMWEGEVQERENGELWGKSHYCGKWFPLLSTAVHKGLFHPNCRHSIGLYRDGDKMPEPVDNTESERLYALEQKQRRLENNVRKARRRAEGLTDPENAKKAAKEVRDAQKKLRYFIAQVNADEGRTVLKRDYEREKIYSGESVDKSAESGIIESGSDEMYRKPKPDKIEPMPRKQFRKIVKSFRRNGGIIQFDDDTEKYLDSKNAEAITYNENTILIRQNPGRASVFEELIHTEQYRNGRNDGSYKCRLECEIEAQKKLIKYSRAYNLTEREILQTKKALEAYENELREYYKNGGV